MAFATNISIVALVAVVLTGCTRTTSSTTSPGDSSQDAASRIADLEARVRDLQGELGRSQAGAEAIAGALRNNADRLQAEIEELRAELDRWQGTADQVGYRLEPAAYGWEQAPRRTCGSNVAGTITPSPHDVQVGALLLPNAAEHALANPEEFAPVDGRYWGSKILAVVSEGARVLLVVPDHEKENASLVYKVRDPTLPGGEPLRISDGERGVVLEGCPDHETQYDGGLLVAGPRCLDLDTYFDGATQGDRITLGFGTQCP
ncbi:MAG: hypothetical protein ACRDVL_04490 [Acidimicrobiia bacterium]